MVVKISVKMVPSMSTVLPLASLCARARLTTLLMNIQTARQSKHRRMQAPKGVADATQAKNAGMRAWKAKKTHKIIHNNNSRKGQIRRNSRIRR